MKYTKGFTLMEILIAMAILGILSTLLIGNYTSTQKKARDATRKSDLKQIQQALEMYLTDKGSYPSVSSGQIVGCGACGGQPSACSWANQSDFRDTVPPSCGTSYIKKMPKDPVANYTYYYWSDLKSYKLYACLENSKDLKIIIPNQAGVNCGGACGTSCNYGVASTNETP